VDLYRFTVSAGQVVTFDIDTTQNGAGGVDSDLRLFDSQAVIWRFNNNAAAPDEGAAASTAT